MIPFLALVYSAAAFFLWSAGHRTLAMEEASRGPLTANVVRSVLAGAIPFSAAVFAFGNWWLLAASIVAMVVLGMLPTSWMLAIEMRRPRQALWMLDRRALRIVERSRMEPLDAPSLWTVVWRMGQIDEPDLSELRDLLMWRYLALWDPASDAEVEVLREVRVDQLERELWPEKRTQSGAAAVESAFRLSLHRAIGEIVVRVRDGSTANTDPTLRAMLDSLTAFRRSDTECLIADVLAWAEPVRVARQPAPDCPTGNALPDYQLQDGAITGRSWLDSTPYFGATLTADDLCRLEDYRNAVLARARAGR